MDGKAPEDHDSSVEPRRTEVLEVEDEDARHDRIQELFERLDAARAPVQSAEQRPFDFGDRSTFPVAPPLELLSRVEAFLPELAASNAALLERARADPASVDIEHLDAEDAAHVEMNIGVGVFEQRGSIPPSSSIPVVDVNLDDRMDESSSESDDSEDMNSSSEEDSSTSDSKDSSSSSESSSEDDAISRPMRPLPKRGAGGRPGIVVLNSDEDHSVDT